MVLPPDERLFPGQRPQSADSDVFYSDSNVTVYYLPGTTGWGSTFGGRPTALWSQVPTIEKQSPCPDG